MRPLLRRSIAWLPVLLLPPAAILFTATVIAEDAAPTAPAPDKTALPARGLCAHRGAQHSHPENTLPALQEAVRLGAQMIEFDICLTKDSALVLMHDTTVDRTTNGSGKVGDLTLGQIRALDAGSWKDARFAGTRVPTFEEVLLALPRTVWLNCHLKGSAPAGKAAAETILRLHCQAHAFLAAEKEAAAAACAVSPQILICNMERQTDPALYVRETLAMKAAFIQFRGSAELPLTELARLTAAGIRINCYDSDNSAAALRRQFDAGIGFPLVDDLAKAFPVAAAYGITAHTPAPAAGPGQ